MQTTPRAGAEQAPVAAAPRFDDLGLIEPLTRSLRAEGYVRPTPIQVQAIPPALAGRDVLGCAQTGTGKTAAFALPILQRLSAAPAPGRGARRPVRALVLSPTRELAAQIGESFSAYGRHLALSNVVIFGGVGQDAQAKALARGVDVLVATPGRLLDLMGQRLVAFDRLEVLVLDEADRMLDMGFLPDVRRVLAALPPVRQTLFFSATMPPDIRALSDTILRDPAYVAVTPAATTVDAVEQRVYFVDKESKPALLRHLLGDRSLDRVLVFTRTKHGANRVAAQLERAGVGAEAIHGNKSQNARERALAGFKSGRIRVLVATDIAARGIDIDDLSHVLNYDLPNVPETYVHRIGRTGRAGASGVALSFCDEEERAYLVDIERLIRKHVPRADGHPYAVAPPPPTDLEPRGGRRASAPAPARARGEGAQEGGGGAGRKRRRRRKGDGRPPQDAAARAAAPRAPGHEGAAHPKPRPAPPREGFRPATRVQPSHPPAPARAPSATAAASAGNADVERPRRRRHFGPGR
ncbi:MAG TPA: DEAD/DEAH box helicase [Polyangiaceae bacterium]|nr:DEAD/DEAH box helicase [Polyangiaceae bacterium]